MESDSLSLDEARRRLLEALTRYWPKASFQVNDRETLVRDYGWVFRLDVTGNNDTEATMPRLALVNKRASQAVWTDRAYALEEFADLFDELLKKSRMNAANWCLSQMPPTHKLPDLAEEARTSGLRELTL